MKRHYFVLITLALLASMLLAACGGGADEPTAAPTTAPAATTAPVEQATEAPAAPVATEAPAATTGDMMSVGASAEGAASAGLTCLADAYNGKMSGTVVSMSGPFTDEDQVRMAFYKHLDQPEGTPMTTGQRIRLESRNLGREEGDFRCATGSRHYPARRGSRAQGESHGGDAAQ